MAKTIRELNEALDKYINEQEINEISDELKQNVLNTRRQQAQDAMDKYAKTSRLVGATKTKKQDGPDYTLEKEYFEIAEQEIADICSILKNNGWKETESEISDFTPKHTFKKYYSCLNNDVYCMITNDPDAWYIISFQVGTNEYQAWDEASLGKFNIPGIVTEGAKGWTDPANVTDAFYVDARFGKSAKALWQQYKDYIKNLFKKLDEKQPEADVAEGEKLEEILRLGYKDVTGPKQKQEGSIMLQGELTGRGYRIYKGNTEEYTAYSLNNFGVGCKGPYRTGNIVETGSLLDCLNAVYDNAEKHLIRMKKRQA